MNLINLGAWIPFVKSGSGRSWFYRIAERPGQDRTALQCFGPGRKLRQGQGLQRAESLVSTILAEAVFFFVF